MTDSTFTVDWALRVLATTGTPTDRKVQQCLDLQAASGGALSPVKCRELVEQVVELQDADDVMLLADDGSPLGMVSPRLILEEGSRFAFALAEVCHDKAALTRVQEETLRRVGPDSFGYIAASALTFMAENILSGAFAVAKAYGTDLQAGMAAFARGGNPNEDADDEPSTPALERLEHIIAMPEGPDRQAAMEAAQTDTGDLGRLTRAYLLNIDKLRRDDR